MKTMSLLQEVDLVSTQDKDEDKDHDKPVKNLT